MMNFWLKVLFYVVLALIIHGIYVTAGLLAAIVSGAVFGGLIYYGKKLADLGVDP